MKAIAADLKIPEKTAWYHLMEWRKRVAVAGCALALVCIAAMPPVPKVTRHAAALRSPKGAEIFTTSGFIPPAPKPVSFSIEWDYPFLDPNVDRFRCYYWTNHGATNLYTFMGRVTNGTLTSLAPKVDWYASLTAVATYTNGFAESDWSRIVCNHPTNLILHFDYIGTNLQTKTSIRGNWTTQNKTSLNFTNIKTGVLFIRGMGKTNDPTFWCERF